MNGKTLATTLAIWQNAAKRGKTGKKTPLQITTNQLYTVYNFTYFQSLAKRGKINFTLLLF